LHPQGQPVTLSQVIRDPKAIKTQDDFACRPDMNDIHLLMRYHNSAVLTYNSLVPEAVCAPFSVAGEKFEQDFNRYCSSLVFLPFLAKEGWAAGFELSMAGCASEEIKTFLASAPEYLKTKFQTTIFLHPLAELGQPLPGQLLHWPLAQLIGRVKVGQLAIAKGLPISQEGRDAFSYLYQREMVIGLTNYLIDNIAGFAGSSDRIAYDKFISGLDKQIAYAFQRMKNPEINLVKQLEVFGTADKA